MDKKDEEINENKNQIKQSYPSEETDEQIINSHIRQLIFCCMQDETGKRLKRQLKTYPNIDVQYEEYDLFKIAAVYNNINAFNVLLKHFNNNYQIEQLQFNRNNDDISRLFRLKKLESILLPIAGCHELSEEMEQLFLKTLNRKTLSQSNYTEDSYEERQQNFDDLNINFPPQNQVEHKEQNNCDSGDDVSDMKQILLENQQNKNIINIVEQFN